MIALIVGPPAIVLLLVTLVGPLVALVTGMGALLLQARPNAKPAAAG